MTYDAPTLIERLGMSKQASSSLLKRLETINTPLFQRIEMMGTNNPIHQGMNYQELMMGIAKSTNYQDQTKETEILRMNPLSMDKVIDNFRHGEITKLKALSNIISILDFNPSRTEPAKDAAVEYYVKTLNKVEALTSSVLK